MKSFPDPIKPAIICLNMLEMLSTAAGTSSAADDKIKSYHLITVVPGFGIIAKLEAVMSDEFAPVDTRAHISVSPPALF